MKYMYEQLSDMWLSTEEIGAVQLCFATEIMPKSTFLCENRSAIRYGFHASAKAIWLRVKTALKCKGYVQNCTRQK